MLLLLKIIVVAGFVAGVTLTSRRWGHRVGGLLTALPVVAGPTLCFCAIEHGKQFAAKAAQAALLGLVAVTVFAFVYTWSCIRTKYSLSLLLAWSAFAGATTVLYHVRMGLVLSLTLPRPFERTVLLERCPGLFGIEVTPHMSVTLQDRQDILDLMTGWMHRDLATWDRLAQLFHPDGTIEVTWFEGLAQDFIEGSVKMGKSDFRSKHFIWQPIVRFDEAWLCS